MTPQWVIGGLEQRYCRKNPDYFRGCFASLDKLAQQVNPLFRVVLEAEVKKNQPVILATKTLRVVQNTEPIEIIFNQQLREFWKAERLRYEAVNRLIPIDVAPEIEELSTKLLAMRAPLLPYEVARVVNTAQAYTYDPQSQYTPTFRYNAMPVPIPRPGPGFRFVSAPKGWVVSQVLRPSSAYEQGVKRGDFLISVDGRPVAGLDKDTVVGLLEKNENQPVQLSVLREGQTLHFALTTKMYTHNEYILKTYEVKGQKFGYLGIETTNNTAVAIYCNHIAQELMKFEKEVRGLILDVRGVSITDSPEMAACLAGYFVGSKQYIFASKSLSDATQFHKALSSTKKVFWKPLVILQDEETEGAMELLSGSLKDLGRAFVVGETTIGNGTEPAVSTIHRVDRFETAYVQYLPSGESHHNVGVTPNIKVFRAETPNEFESTALRYYELGVAQVIPGKVAPLAALPSVDLVSIDCLKQQDVKRQYYALPPQSQDKDLQLLTGLNALYCSQR